MNSTSRLTAGLAAMMAASIVGAQTKPKPDGEWRGSIGIGFSNSSGNTKATSFTGNADAVKQTGIDKLGFYLQSVYGKARVDGTDRTTAHIFRAGGRYDRDLSERVFGFGGLDFEKNKLADVKLRTLPQLGVGYHLVKNDINTFDVFTGVAYNYLDRYSGRNFRGTELLFGEESTHKLSDSTSFRQRLVVYSSLKDTGEYRAMFDAGLITAVVGGWNLTVTVANRYDSNPPPGIKKNDFLLFTGLQYGWGPR